EERSRSDAVGVVVSKNDERLVAAAGQKQSLDRRGHVGQQEGIAELLQSRFQKFGRLAWFAQSPVDQALRQQGRHLQFPGQVPDQERLPRRDGPAKFHPPPHPARAGRARYIRSAPRFNSWSAEFIPLESPVLAPS